MREIISYTDLKTIKGLGENYWHVLGMSADVSQENSKKKMNGDYSNPNRLQGTKVQINQIT